MLRRGTIVISNASLVMPYRAIDNLTPTMRVRALQRLDGLRRRVVWHTLRGWKQRVAHVPGGWG